LIWYATGQPPDGEPAKEAKTSSKDYSNSWIVIRMMKFDKNHDGKLTRDEITDPRLLRLFDRADTNKDGVVTKEELAALAAKLEQEGPQGRGGGRPGFGPPPGGDFGGPPEDGPDGPGFRGRGPGGGGPPRPGQILPGFVQEMLNLTASQKKQIQDLQKEVDDRLAKILTDSQKRQLQHMRPGPGRFGGPPGGPPDGPPLDGPGGE